MEFWESITGPIETETDNSGTRITNPDNNADKYNSKYNKQISKRNNDTWADIVSKRTVKNQPQTIHNKNNFKKPNYRGRTDRHQRLDDYGYGYSNRF